MIAIDFAMAVSECFYSAATRLLILKKLITINLQLLLVNILCSPEEL